ncbi:hypothetical protein Bbelb_317330 [Branchiostoma belcheri]|nr:hypothetical protein Bbelb_317330 [Branchiostoma belcheri]
MFEKGTRTRTFRSNIAMFTDGDKNLKSEELIHYVLAGQAVQHNQQVPADLMDLIEDNIQIDDSERTYNRRQRQEERENDPDHIALGQLDAVPDASILPVISGISQGCPQGVTL